MVAPTPSYQSKVIPWDYVAEERWKGKAKVEEIDASQGMTRTGRVYTLEHLGGTSKETASKPLIIETIPDDLWRKVRKLGGETYHRIECVNAIEKEKWWSNKIESTLLWIGYDPSKGLGKNLQGITKPVQLKRHGTTFGLGYEYTWQEYQDWSPPWRDPYYPLE
uniref:Endogenous retrovirus group K member 113 Pro protein-like n=1 Tax=Nicotiana tabacum TaxID=4097 RepID=A0A1S4CIF5_TOBAC|nr:PREDICTED: endogenous retrovirus group K member 113 Pro protein-like [Nicotiana tabacum]